MTDQQPGRDDDQPDLADILRQLMGGLGGQGTPGAPGGPIGFQPPGGGAGAGAGGPGAGGPGAGMPGLPDLSALGIDPATLGMVQAQLQAIFTGGGEGPLNPTLVGQTARRLAAGDDPSVGEATQRDVEQVVQVATLWLDQVTDLAAPTGGAVAWSRAEWIDQTLPVWTEALAPVAKAVGEAMTGALTAQMGSLAEGGLPEGLQGMPGVPADLDPSQMLAGMRPVLERMSGSMFSAQLGQAVGGLAGEVVTGTEVGLPLVSGERVAVLPANVAAFAEGLEIEPGEVHLYLAVREAARVRLFSRVPWLAPQIIAAVTEYASDIRIDTEGIEAGVASIDPTDAEALREALQGKLFHPVESPRQKAALARLETWLALVEGWVDLVTKQAVGGHLPNAAALAETVRRRRATGGPAEKMFASLVGLRLRPRRLRDAANLWALLDRETSAADRDAVWGHPDNAPVGADLDDPIGFVERTTGRRLERAAVEGAPEAEGAGEGAGEDVVPGSDESAASVEPDGGTDAIDAELEKLLSGGYDDLSVADDGTTRPADGGDSDGGGGDSESDSDSDGSTGGARSDA